MEWQPAAESLLTLIRCLHTAQRGDNREAQLQAEGMLRQAEQSPDFCNYLALIFSNPAQPVGLGLSPAEYGTVRCVAGIHMKNTIKASYKKIPEASIALIKVAVPRCLQDENPQVRNYAGNIATELVRAGGLYAWPGLLNDLLALIGNATGQVAPATQEAAISAMAKICEDNAKLLDREHNGERPLNVLLPKLIEASGSPLPKVRAGALQAINEFVWRKSQAMLVNIDMLMQRLFALMLDPTPDVRRQLCRAFVQLVETRADKLQPYFGSIIEYIIVQQKDEEDEDLACQAAEFWLSVGEHETFWKALEPYLAKVIPVLLEGIVYSGEDIAIYGGAEDDDDEDDREEDIRPQFARRGGGRTTGDGANANGNGSAGANASTYQNGDSKNGGGVKSGSNGAEDLEEGEIGDDDNDDDDDYDNGDDMYGDDEDNRWTVRKGSAAALDVLARDFGNPLFECVLPYLMTNLKHEDWPQREAAVLALGAVAGGCMDAVTPHLPQLVPYLMSLLNDPEPLVRQITCWALSRYSTWAAELTDPAQTAAFFVPMMEGLLTKMLDRNKKVQEAAASAMASLEERAGTKMGPYAGPIINQYIQCFDKYKDRNMHILYDCVQTLAEAIGPELARPELVSQLMPALFRRYESVADQSRELFPLLECFSYVAVSLGEVFSPYAQPVFRRCVSIIHQNLEQALAAAGNVQLDHPDKDFLVTSLDLISAVIQALAGSESGHDGTVGTVGSVMRVGPAGSGAASAGTASASTNKAAALVKDTQPAFFELLTFCLEDPSNDVRQSAYAVLGDCAKYVFAELQPWLGTVLPILLKQLDMDSVLHEELLYDDGFSVINNACWSVGEIAVHHNAEGMAPYLDELLKACVEFLATPRVPRGVRENAAIVLGRLGLCSSTTMAPLLTSYADEFLTAMEAVDPSEEKASAFRGFTLVVARNPQAMEPVLLRYFRSIARYEDMNLRSPMKQELQLLFRNVLFTYRQLIPHFDTFLSQLDPQDVNVIKTKYGV